jgi:hypothetical protein
VGVAPGVFVSAYNAVVAKSYRVVNSADIVPILPPSCLALTKDVNLEFAQVTKNVVTFGAQMGSIGGNHACVDTYSVYLGLLAQNFSTVSSHLLAS